jgi:hypothetical protein
VRADGTPILNVTVRAERIRWAADLPGSAGQASTDKDGSFEITGVSEGEFRLTFEGATETVLPPLDQVTAGSEILVQGEAGRFIGGKVVDREGQPARGRVVAVPLDPDGYAARDAYAAEDGTFRVGPLKGSRFALVGGSASKYGFALDVEAGATDVPLVLGKGDVLAGRIVDKDGKLSAGNLALFHEKLAHTWQAWTEDGQFRMEGLPPGTYFAYATPRNQYVVAPTRGGPGRSWTRIESGTTDATLTIR